MYAVYDVFCHVYITWINKGKNTKWIYLYMKYICYLIFAVVFAAQMLPTNTHLQFVNQHSSKWTFVSICNSEIICTIRITGLDPDMVTFLHFTQHHFCSGDGPSAQWNMKSFFYSVVNPQFSLCDIIGNGYRCPGKLVSPRHRSNKYTISSVEMISLVYRYFVELYYGVSV